jgi:hypothetical protein
MNQALEREKFKRLEEIVKTYKRFESELFSGGISFRETKGGIWAPTSLELLFVFLDSAIEKQVITPNGPIVDAGSGDGRVSAVFDVYGFNPIINIEIDEKLVGISTKVLDYLMQRSILSNNIKTICGDFTKSETYKKADIQFKDIPYFYQGINYGPLEKLAEKIKNESPDGTKLIVYGLFFKKNQMPKIPLQLEWSVRAPYSAEFLIYKK